MDASILKTFLRLNLIDLGGDDNRLQKLESAANLLGRIYAKSPIKALPVFLGVLSDAPPNGEVFVEVGEKIEIEWPTYHGAFKDGKALTLFKAVSMQALAEAITLQPPLGVAITHLFRNFGPLVEMGKNEEAFRILVKIANEAYDAELDIDQVHDTAPFVISAPPKPTKFDRAALQKRIDSAVGPQNRAGQPGENANVHWPNTGNPWSYEFSDRMTLILGDYIDAVLSKAVEADTKVVSNINAKMRDVIAQSNTHLTRSNALLWWRQALYSNSGQKPYRELSSNELIIHAAIDLSALVEPAYEPAVDSFLSEAIIYLLTEKVECSYEEISSSARDKAGNFALPELADSPGLIICDLFRSQANSFTSSVKLPLHKWAVWLFREIKALQAIAAPRAIEEEQSE